MFRVKVCGVTSVADAVLVAEAGADAIGLNFYSKSARQVPLVVAESIVAALPPMVKRVGVFVNHSAEDVVRYVERLQLDIIQLHGDERPETAVELAGRPVLRALRCRSDDWERGAEWVEAFLDLGGNLVGLLIDAFHPDEYGGTGRLADSLVFQAFRRRFAETPLILAGGLTPTNVADVIAEVRPDGVDTASGVEASPGVKDARKVRTFVAQASQALSLINK